MSTKQLYEKTSEGMKEVSPLVSIEDIYSKLSDTPLEALVSLFNHVKCEWKGSVADTRRTVPLFLRRSGLFITYNNGTKYITEFFSAGTDQITTEGWVKDSNWTSVPDEDYISAGVKPGVGSIGYEQLNDNLKQLFREKVNVTNFPDDEDIASVDNMLKLKDREVDAAKFQSKGYVILRKNLRLVNGVVKNILTQKMISKPNTIYEIRYDFDLNGETINIPENCTLKFKCGTLNNGILSNSLYISCDKNSICFLDKLRFNNAILKNREVYANWFGDLSYELDSAIVIQRCIHACNNTNDIILPTHSMSIYSSIIIDKNIRIKGVYDAKRDIYHTYFDVKTSNISVFVISNQCEIDNVSISSNTQLERQWIAFILKQGTGITLRNTSVVRADIAYYLGKTPDNGYLNATELNCVSATYCNKGIWLEHSEFTSVWKNATKIIPSQISFCDICIQIDMGNSTDIYGGACEIGASDTLPYQKNKIGILVQNRAVVNLFGGLWLENLDIPILTKDTAIVNVCGDLVQLSNGVSKDNSVIKYNTLQSHRCIFDDEVTGNLLSVDDNLVFDLNADDMKFTASYTLKAGENKYLATSRDNSLNNQLMFLKRLDGINYFDSPYGFSKPVNEIKSEQCTIIIDGLYLYKESSMSNIFFDNVGLALGGYSKTDKNLCVSACAVYGFDKTKYYNIGYRGINREEDDIKNTYKHITLAITFDFKKKIATLIKLDDFVANDNVTLENWKDGYIPTLNKLTGLNTSTFLFRRIIMFKQCMNTYQLKYIKHNYLNNNKVNRYDEVMALTDEARNIRISDNYNNVYDVISKFNFDTNRLEVSGLIKVSNYYQPALLLGSFANLTNEYKVDLSRLCVIQNKYQNKDILITYDDDNNEIIYELEQKLNKTGTTEDRPKRPSIGFIYKDTTLDKLIIWEGTKWINLDGTKLV